MEQGKVLFVQVMRIRSSRTQGFTIPELIVVMTVIGILTGLIFGPFDDLYSANVQSLQTIIQATDTRGALRQIEREITASKQFLRSSDIDINGDTPYTNSINKWTWDGAGTPSVNSPKHVLITENYATDTNTGDVVKAADCSTPLTINYVFFVYNDILYRRTLKTLPTPTTCGGASIAQKRTCHTLSLDTVNCEGRDAQIITGVKNLEVEYYSNSNDSNALLFGPSSTSKTVTLKLTTTSKSGLSSMTTMRMTRMNGS